MALTAALNVKDSENVMGKYRANIVDFTCDSSYPALGYPIPAADFGFKGIYFLDPVPANAAAGAYELVYDITNKTLRLWVNSSGAELGTGQSAAGVVVRALVLGF